MRVPLSRPEAPVVQPRSWPTRSVAVLGLAQNEMAGALLDTWRARRLEVVLRHAAGFEQRALDDGDRITAHPEALSEALSGIAPDTPTVGVGAGFAVGVRADHIVYVGSLSSMLGLEPPLRAVVRSATLHLERPRPDALRALGRRLGMDPWLDPLAP
ncbi:MAG: hypothetical protein AB8I08_35295 [Sandaracinaceae bacterium]